MTPRIALVGAGSMGANHARVISQSSRARLEVIIDPFRERAEPLAEGYGARWAADLSSLDGCDGVVIAAPTPLHAQLLDEALTLGIPTLVEKPLTDDQALTRAAVRRSQEQGTILMCGFLERYNAAILTALGIVENPLHITATRHSPYAPRIQTGVSWDLLVHDVDLILRFAQGAGVTNVSSSRGYFHAASLEGADDVAELLLDFDNGITAHASASRISHRKIRGINIVESDRLIEVDLLRRDVTIFRHLEESSDNGRGYRQQSVIEIPEKVPAPEPLEGQLNRFLDLIAGEGDVDAERASIVSAHDVIAESLRVSGT